MIIANRSRGASANASGFLPVPGPDQDISNPMQRNASAVFLSNNVAAVIAGFEWRTFSASKIFRYWSDAGRNGRGQGRSLYPSEWREREPLAT